MPKCQECLVHGRVYNVKIPLSPDPPHLATITLLFYIIVTTTILLDIARCHNAYNLPDSYSTAQVLPLHHKRVTMTRVLPRLAVSGTYRLARCDTRTRLTRR